MVPSRRIPWLLSGTLTTVALVGLCGVRAQDAEQPTDEAVPQRGVRRGRGTAGNLARDRANATSEATSAGVSGAEANADREPVDTSKNQRIVIRVEHTTASMLANVLVKHFQGVAGLSIIPSVTSNSLLVSSPPK